MGVPPVQKQPRSCESPFSHRDSQESLSAHQFRGKGFPRVWERERILRVHGLGLQDEIAEHQRVLKDAHAESGQCVQSSANRLPMKSPIDGQPRTIAIALTGVVLLSFLISFTGRYWIRGDVPIFFPGWNAALGASAVDIRVESPEGNILLFRPAGLTPPSQPSETLEVIRFNVTTKVVTTVGVDVWERATGATQIAGQSRRLPSETRTAAEQAAIGSRGAEPRAAKYGVDMVACTRCPDIVAVLSAEGPLQEAHGWAAQRVYGQHFVELRNWRTEIRIGKALPVQFDEKTWHGCWTADCRFLVYTSGIGANFRIAVISVSDLAGGIPCANSNE